MNKINTLLILSIFILISSCSDDDGPSIIDATILPGEGLEGLVIGTKGSEVEDEVGNDYFEVSASVGNDLWNYQMDYDALGLAFNMERAEEDANIRDLEVIGITITAPYMGTTAEGIGIGSTKQEVEDAYPDPEIFEFWNSYEYEGISYTFDESDEVRRIFVFD
ncbi:MAG TPA: hypothetical protein VJ917_05580 [Saprospiraceae bacterium]|nr:hypothetical protein [Saprospiraceae bacterium]